MHRENRSRARSLRLLSQPTRFIAATVRLRFLPTLALTEEKFYPALESLRWREKHLTTKY